MAAYLKQGTKTKGHISICTDWKYSIRSIYIIGQWKKGKDKKQIERIYVGKELLQLLLQQGRWEQEEKKSPNNNKLKMISK